MNTACYDTCTLATLNGKALVSPANEFAAMLFDLQAPDAVRIIDRN